MARRRIRLEIVTVRPVVVLVVMVVHACLSADRTGPVSPARRGRQPHPATVNNATGSLPRPSGSRNPGIHAYCRGAHKDGPVGGTTGFCGPNTPTHYETGPGVNRLSPSSSAFPDGRAATTVT